MRPIIRLFFRTLRLVLAPFMLISEKLTRGNALERSPAQQAEVDAETARLALYQFSTCPFCIKVRKRMHQLNLNIEQRDTQHNATHRQALEQGGGRVKVPCLLITHDDGREEWMYESDTINAYLQKRFGRAA
ncbi:glutathione S-transferase N-terminal domain-containing protein [Cobetia sp. 3AK]|uniref:glutaredoxin family protein n=1 Tax=Cobetia sp. 3AK TaxID=3040020 RepID=UPI00244A4E10|nr:glutathione S-transferase N-terminal domain-containing protein [Cobetia sp. 3AK]MDH2372362.1 glutathione S-transferase N-terminal domain-containing protein [Cobetia sp. 3AK]